MNQAKIPLTDRGLLFGHSVFETILVLKGKIVFWQKHINRMKHGCLKTNIPIFDEKRLQQRAESLIQRLISNNENKIPERISLRIIITAGASYTLSLLEDVFTPCEYLFAKVISSYSQSDKIKSVSLMSFLDQRNKSLIDVKSCNYLFNYLCIDKSTKKGFDDAIFIDEKGFFTEGTTFNFIWIKDEKTICCSPLEENCLPGTTLAQLIERIAQTDFCLAWEALHQKEMTNILGCAILSSTRLIIPVARIDDFHFPENNNTVLELRKILEKNLL